MGGDVSDLLTRDLLDVPAVVRRVDAETIAELLCSDALVKECRRLAAKAFDLPEGAALDALLGRQLILRVATRCGQRVQDDVDACVDLRYAIVERLCVQR